MLTKWSLPKFACHMLLAYSTHTHTCTALCPGLPTWAGTRKAKLIWILLKQETVSGSGISWAICKSAPHSRQITTPAPHRSVFLQAGCHFCCPTNSIKALKAIDAAAINRYLWPAGPTAANQQQWVCSYGPMLGQTDGQTPHLSQTLLRLLCRQCQ